MSGTKIKSIRAIVAPFTGAWIEIYFYLIFPRPVMSLPSRGRGLKSNIRADLGNVAIVAPFTGAWIEI